MAVSANIELSQHSLQIPTLTARTCCSRVKFVSHMKLHEWAGIWDAGMWMCSRRICRIAVGEHADYRKPLKQFLTGNNVSSWHAQQAYTSQCSGFATLSLHRNRPVVVLPASPACPSWEKVPYCRGNFITFAVPLSGSGKGKTQRRTLHGVFLTFPSNLAVAPSCARIFRGGRVNAGASVGTGGLSVREVLETRVVVTSFTSPIMWTAKKKQVVI